MVRTERLVDEAVLEPSTDPGIVESYLEDASGAAPGRAAGLLRISDAAQAATFLRRTANRALPVLFQAARSSLTGGAIPRGEIVLSVERMTDIGAVERHPGGARIRAQAGVRLVDLQYALRGQGFYFPPVPTYQEAMVGGVLSTNAGGAASFKYGVTRDWVHGLDLLLFNGERLRIERGQAVARPGESFRVELTDGRRIEAPVPTYRLPPLKKISAGYHASDPLDLVDLFVGSEGTLGLILEATLDLVPLPPSLLTGLAFLDERRAALELSASMRLAAERARVNRDPLGPDVRSIELLDRNSLDLLIESDRHHRLRIRVPERSHAALLFELELPSRTSNDEAQAIVSGWLTGTATGEEGPIPRLLRLLDDHVSPDGLELAFPEDDSRRRALGQVREAVPLRVSEILSERCRQHPGIQKVGGDLIVPFDRLGEMVEIYEQGFRRRGLEFAIWGHVSDGNLHPNAIPRNVDEVRGGFESMLEFADAATQRGGAPLSEHGVGRSSIKQEILRRFLGTDALSQMRAIKRAFDPQWRLAPGVLLAE